mgnify:CR=1 FL=1
MRRVPVRELHLVAGGEPSPVDLTASFLRDGRGRVVQTVCVLRDASARHRGDSQRGELISTLAHELRSPLTSVKGFTSTLLHRWERFSDDQKREMLATVNMDADRVTRLIRELLDVSRIDAGRLELRRTEFDLAAMAEGIVGRFDLQHDGHSFQIAFPDDFPRVYADPDKIEQVLTNLVENAVKYSDGGAVTVTGRVCGTGIGIACRATTDVTPRRSTSSAGSSEKSTMSIFSSCSSFMTARTREPISPMQAPLHFFTWRAKQGPPRFSHPSCRQHSPWSAARCSSICFTCWRVALEMR